MRLGNPVGATLVLGLLGPSSASAMDVAASQAVRGGVVEFVVSGAIPGETVWVAVSGQLGAGPCPRVLNGLCLDLVGPQLVGSGTASAGGEVRFTRPVAAATALGDYQIQAVQGGSTPAKTPTVRLPVLQILSSTLTVTDSATLHDALYTLSGDLDFAPGAYATDLVLEHFQTGSVTLRDLELSSVSLPAWSSGGSLTVGTPSAASGPRVNVDASALTELDGLVGWAWGAGGGGSFPSLTTVGAIWISVVGVSERTTTFDLPALTSITGSFPGLSGIELQALSGAAVWLNLGRFDGARFATPPGGLPDVTLRGTATVSAPALTGLPGNLLLDGAFYGLPWVDAPVLTELGRGDGVSGLAVRTTGWSTLDGLLPAMIRSPYLEITDNPFLVDLGLVGDPAGLSVDQTWVSDNPSLSVEIGQNWDQVAQ